MTLPPVVSSEEWLAARKALLAKEKEATRARDALNAERRALPMVRVEKEYVFDGPTGKASLLDLFEGRHQLIVQHFMFDPSWDEGCPTCSADADSLPHLAHLHARDTSFAAVSRAPLPKIERFKTRMGWTFPWYSSHGTDFYYDFHVTLDESVTPVVYNFRPSTISGEMPGVSVFLRDGDTVYHTYTAYARGTDQLSSFYNLLDLTPFGRQEGWGGTPDLDGLGDTWLRHHDRY
jgi:predicted dithiol-disulfide oxidoreductase (DUF899 family)